MEIKLEEYLFDEVEKKILVPENFYRIHLKRLDTNKIYSLVIDESTLNNTLIYLFSKAFGTPDGVIVWDWYDELSSIKTLLSGEILELDQINIKNLQTTVDINIHVWLDK